MRDLIFPLAAAQNHVHLNKILQLFTAKKSKETFCMNLLLISLKTFM